MLSQRVCAHLIASSNPCLRQRLLAHSWWPDQSTHMAAFGDSCARHVAKQLCHRPVVWQTAHALIHEARQ